MRIAGVRGARGKAYWVDAGETACPPLARVTIEVGDERLEGIVFIGPEQLVRPPEAVVGRILHVDEVAGTPPDCDDLPGADLPALGTRVRDRTIVGIDAVARTVTLRSADGEEIRMRAGDELDAPPAEPDAG